MAGIPKSRRHGRTRTPEYRAWTDMRGRCTKPALRNYQYYGARGITVCPEWEDFATFFADMGPRPAGMSIERLDNEKGYSPDNCVWASDAQQHRNTRQTRKVEIDGVTRCLKDWCALYVIDYNTVKHRVIKLGWPAHQALTMPTAARGRGASKESRTCPCT